MMSEPYSVVFIDYGILKDTHLGRKRVRVCRGLRYVMVKKCKTTP
jgi:hypothetical protein